MANRMVGAWVLAAACTSPEPGHERVDDTTPVASTAPVDTATPVLPEPPPYQGPLQFDGDPPRNVLFLSIDTYRRDHLDVHGGLGLTPFLNTLTDQAMVLTDHYQCSDWTYGSTTCTLSGMSNVRRGHLPSFARGPLGAEPVPAGTSFLATYLGRAGYHSILSCGNPWLSRESGNAQGYNTEIRREGADLLEVGRAGMLALQGAIGRGEVDRGWFLHLHFLDTHSPYDPDEAYIEGLDALEPWPRDLTNSQWQYQATDRWPEMSDEERELLKAHLTLLYQAEVRELDANLEILWGELRDQGLLDDTLVVVWNDHGEQFWEHGWQSHAQQLYGEENDGILFFWANNLASGEWTEATSALDLVPTMLELYRIRVPPELEGYAVGHAPPGRPIFAEAYVRQGGQQMVVVGPHKLHYSWTGEATFFDRSVDRGEQHDLFDSADPTVRELWEHLRPMVDLMTPLGQDLDGSTPVIPTGL